MDSARRHEAIHLVRALGLRGALLLLAATLLASSGSAQEPIATPVTVEPASPVQGTLFRVIVNAGSDVTGVTGTAAGEALHFERGSDGRYTALAGAPLDGGGKLDLRVTLARPSSSEPVQVTVPVASGSYALDRLTVAPNFGTRPNAALQARIDRERESALGVSRRSHGTPRLWEIFARPRDTRITSGFGNGREFNGNIQSRHTGTDFAGAVGEPVFAAARGLVALVDDFYLAGKVVYLDHGQGLVTAYFHLSETMVSSGDTVSAGQPIGKVGATGRVTGPHLHWVVRYGAISLDPMSLLAIAGK
ncbi:MAG: M23 family metallopeptidase [Pseudomonas sp.]